MSNTSATGGYLLPAASPAPLEGQSFEDFLQQVFVGVSGLAGELVRPRWQVEPANMPDRSIDWMSFGITSWDPDIYAVEQHDGPNNESNLIRHETVEISFSFYGPNASTTMAILRDGFQIAQNREVFQLNAIGLQETGPARNIPFLLKEKWLTKIDMSMIIRRQILRTYPILNIISALGDLHTDSLPLPHITEALTA